jgi:hypothetical protein
MFGLTPDDARQLKLFGWFLLITNGLIVGMGLLFGRALEERSGAVALILAVAVLVNGCFFLIVAGNIAAVALGHLARRARARRPPPDAGDRTV